MPIQHNIPFETFLYIIRAPSQHVSSAECNTTCFNFIYKNAKNECPKYESVSRQGGILNSEGDFLKRLLVEQFTEIFFCWK